MKPDINDTFLRNGPDAVRARHDAARLYTPESDTGGQANVVRLHEQPPAALIVSTVDFIGGFVPPDYLIEGLLQRRFLYSLTAPTGAGKTAIALRLCAHIAMGLSLDGRKIERGKVLFLAGENPDDVRMRWIKQLQEMRIDPNECNVFFRPGVFDLSDAQFRGQLDKEIQTHGPLSLIVVDTSAAFFTGDEENSNVQLGNHARMLRSFVDSAGGPTVLVTCHPPKNASQENLLPRGGGAFVAEVDGNLVCYKSPDNHIVELHWQQKFRGPDFAPLPFLIDVGTVPELVDSGGRAIPTVTARPISDAEVTEQDAAARHRQESVLAALQENPGASLTDVAKKLAWFYRNGEPNRSQVNRSLQALKGRGLIKKEGGEWVLTKAGNARNRRETLRPSE